MDYYSKAIAIIFKAKMFVKFYNPIECDYFLIYAVLYPFFLMHQTKFGNTST